MNKLEELKCICLNFKEMELQKLNKIIAIQDMIADKNISNSFIEFDVNSDNIYLDIVKNIDNTKSIQQCYLERIERLSDEITELNVYINKYINSAIELISNQKYDEEENYIFIDILIKKYIHDKSYRDISNSLHLSKSTVCNKLNKAKSILSSVE